MRKVCGGDSDDKDFCFLNQIHNVAMERSRHRLQEQHFDESVIVDKGSKTEMIENKNEEDSDNSFKIRKLQIALCLQVPPDWKPHAPKILTG